MKWRSAPGSSPAKMGAEAMRDGIEERRAQTGGQRLDYLDQLVQLGLVREGAGRLESVQKAELGSLGGNPERFASREALLGGGKRLTVVALCQADRGERRLVNALGLSVARATEILIAAQQPAGLIELSTVEVELEDARDWAEQVRVLADLFVRDLGQADERLLPAAEHGQRVRHLTQREPLVSAVADPAGDGDRLLEMGERFGYRSCWKPRSASCAQQLDARV